jgi:hypothetical protein
MAFEILTTQLSVEITTIVTAILTIILSAVITKRYLEKRSRSLLCWAAALWLFAIGVILEIAFAFGVYSELLIATYLLIIAVLVELLAMGSIYLIKSEKSTKAYGMFMVASTILLAYSLITSRIGNIITAYIVSGNIPLPVAIFSSVITFPAAIILVVVAAKSYFKKQNAKLLSIIAGVVTVSAAGTLYIVQYPAFLYIAEFAGILLLIYGFV